MTTKQNPGSNISDMMRHHKIILQATLLLVAFLAFLDEMETLPGVFAGNIIVPIEYAWIWVVDDFFHIILIVGFIYLALNLKKLLPTRRDLVTTFITIWVAAVCIFDLRYGFMDLYSAITILVIYSIVIYLIRTMSHYE